MSDSDEQDELRLQVALRLESQDDEVNNSLCRDEQGTPTTSTTSTSTTASVSTSRNDSGFLIPAADEAESRQHAGGREATIGAPGDTVEGEMLWCEVQRIRKKLRDVERNCSTLNEGANASPTGLNQDRIEDPCPPVSITEAIRATSGAAEGETLLGEIPRVRRKLLRSFHTMDEGLNLSSTTGQRQGETTLLTADNACSAHGISHIGDRTSAPSDANIESTILESPSVQVERLGVEPGAYRVRPQGRTRRRLRRGSLRIVAADDDGDSDDEDDNGDDEGDDGGFSVPVGSMGHSQSVGTGSTLPYGAGLAIADPIYEEDSKPSIVAQATPLRRKVRLMACTLLIVVLGVTGVAVAIALTTQNNNNGGGSTGPTSAPTPAIPLNMSVLLGQFFDGLPAETGAAMNDENSPQSKAYLWLGRSIQVNSTFGQQESPKSILSRMTQRFAMATLYFATSGPTGWTDSARWLDASVSECNWTRCFCSSGPGIYSLDLDGNGLDGSVPLEISFLAPSLNILSLTSNNLKGTLPPQLGNMSTLQQLYATSTQLQGSIPTSFGLMTALTALDLSQNALKGPIPATLGNLPSLSSLVLEDNSLTGTVPSELSLATNLNTFQIAGNRLSGSIPSEICALDGLVPRVDCTVLSCDCCSC